MIVIEMPGALRGITHVRLDRIEWAPDGIRATFTPGLLTGDVFAPDQDMGRVPMERTIAGDDLTAFAAWASAQEAKEFSTIYGVLWDLRSVMRWIGWREYHARLSPDEWDAALPQLQFVMDTEPPEFSE